MDIKDIKELLEALNQTNYKYVDIKHEGTQMILSKEAVTVAPSSTQAAVQATPVTAVQMAPVHVPQVAPVEEINAVKVETSVTNVVNTASDNCHIMKSPIVGTFYAASGPEAAPFVKKGDRVKKGDTLCIIEAMKLMNEVEAEVDGEVLEVLVDNEAIVEYGQPLFKIAQK